MTNQTPEQIAAMNATTGEFAITVRRNRRELAEMTPGWGYVFMREDSGFFLQAGSTTLAPFAEASMYHYHEAANMAVRAGDGTRLTMMSWEQARQRLMDRADSVINEWIDNLLDLTA